MKRLGRLILYSMMLLVLLAGCQPAEPQATSEGAAEPGAAETATVAPTATAEPSATATEGATAEAEPTPEIEEDESGSETAAQPELEVLVRQDLAQRLGITPEEIEVLSKEAVEWPDGSMGCPAPGVMYTQAIVPGYRIVLEAEGELYEYHTDRQQRFLLCENGEPQLPAIPIDPDDIDDGEPWMPVDPLPTVETP